MALHKAGLLLSKVSHSSRSLHTTSSNSFFFKYLLGATTADKPILTDNAVSVGYERHELKYADLPGNPLNLREKDINNIYVPKGSGTKCDPCIIPSTTTSRLVKVDLGDEDFDLPQFEVTLENGGRCPVTGAHYVLDYKPELAEVDFSP